MISSTADWEEFKRFMLQSDVVTSNKPMLTEMFRMYELGWKHAFPEEWKPYQELMALRKLPIYNEIIRAEEKMGRLNGKVPPPAVAVPIPPPTVVTVTNKRQKK